MKTYLLIAGLLISCLGNLFAQKPPALFLSSQQLEVVRGRLDESPYSAQYRTVINRANDYLTWNASPFQMDDISEIKFGWCSGVSKPDDSLKDLTEKLLKDSDRIRYLALAGLLSNDPKYFEAAKEQFMKWVEESTLLNLYDLNINFQSASMDGMTESFCSDRPWNFGLDAIWQAYGLINFSDTYIVLSQNWNELSDEDDAAIRTWLKELAAATNSGFHAWTRWADAHKSSSAFTRYRSDNHLSWALAGITAAAAAMEDETIWDYVLEGGSWNDGRSGNYSNPSHIGDLIDRVIAADGKVYDQNVRASEHKGLFYGNFHLWAMSLTAQMAEVHKGEQLWTSAGEDGGSISSALNYYAPYVSLEKPVPDKDENTDPKFFRFLYEITASKSWATGELGERFLDAKNIASRDQLIQQSIGPVTLLLGDLGDAEINLGKLNTIRGEDGSIVIQLLDISSESVLFYSYDLKDWHPMISIGDNTIESLILPPEQVAENTRFFRIQN